VRQAVCWRSESARQAEQGVDWIGDEEGRVVVVDFSEPP